MRLKHFIVEGYCDKSSHGGPYPCSETGTFGMHCFTCAKFSYCEANNELAYSNAYGVVETLEDWVGFGGDMDPEDMTRQEECIALWQKICRRKIQEAHQEYIEASASLRKKT